MMHPHPSIMDADGLLADLWRACNNAHDGSTIPNAFLEEDVWHELWKRCAQAQRFKDEHGVEYVKTGIYRVYPEGAAAPPSRYITM
jgi:hypothetical protein